MKLGPGLKGKGEGDGEEWTRKKGIIVEAGFFFVDHELPS